MFMKPELLEGSGRLVHTATHQRASGFPSRAPEEEFFSASLPSGIGREDMSFLLLLRTLRCLTINI